MEDERPSEDLLYRAAVERLLHPPRVRQSTRFLLISLALFVGLSALHGTTSVLELAILVGVLFVHELGHAAAMLMCGYRDVRVFFIPLFGAATTGRARGVSRWKQAVVLLAGPLPGIVAGSVLTFEGPASLRLLALMLIAVNAFNLLPLEPLDGGRLFQVLVFSRSRHLEIVFRAVTSAALVLLSVLWSLWFLAAIGVFMLFAVGGRKRLLDRAEPLKQLEWPSDPHALDDARLRTLYDAACSLVPAKLEPRVHASVVATNMEQLLEQATTRTAGVGETVGMLGVWLGGLALSGFALVAGGPYSTPAVDHPDWQTYQRPGFSIELPHPLSTEEVGSNGPVYVMKTRFAEYGVAVVGHIPAAKPWLDHCRSTVISNQPLLRDYDASPDERRFDVRAPNDITAAFRCIAPGTTGYVVFVQPADTEAARRVLQSFRLR